MVHRRHECSTDHLCLFAEGYSRTTHGVLPCIVHAPKGVRYLTQDGTLGCVQNNAYCMLVEMTTSSWDEDLSLMVMVTISVTVTVMGTLLDTPLKININVSIYIKCQWQVSRDRRTYLIIMPQHEGTVLHTSING